MVFWIIHDLNMRKDQWLNGCSLYAARLIEVIYRSNDPMELFSWSKEIVSANTLILLPYGGIYDQSDDEWNISNRQIESFCCLSFIQVDPYITQGRVLSSQGKWCITDGLGRYQGAPLLCTCQICKLGFVCLWIHSLVFFFSMEISMFHP